MVVGLPPRFRIAHLYFLFAPLLLTHLWINGLSTMEKKIQDVFKSDANGEEERIDQPIVENTTCPALDGFKSDSNSGKKAQNPGDGDLPMGVMIRVHLPPRFRIAQLYFLFAPILLTYLWINGLSTMEKKIQDVFKSDANGEEESIDQPMVENTTCPALDGFKSDSDSGNEAQNPGDGDLPMGVMIRVHLQCPIPLSVIIQTPICINHQRRQERLDPTLKKRVSI